MTSKRHIEYKKSQLTREHLSNNPFVMFEAWYGEALNEMGDGADAMVLSTVDNSDKPHSRIVLLKEFSEDGFIFFSNYGSDKGQQLKINPSASLLFFWPKMERQVRIEGLVQQTSKSESDTYWGLRSRGSQIGAIVSPQSSVIPNRSFLENRYKDFSDSNKKIKRPENWGGYRLIPDRFEFWQGREHRLNDRFVYFRTDRKEWDVNRLAP